LGIAQALKPSRILLRVPHNLVFGDFLLEGFGGVGAVFNARELVCGCVNRARKFTPHARVMFLNSRRVKTHMTHVWLNFARINLARAIGFGEGRGPAWPFGTHHVDGMLGCVLVPTTPTPRVAHVGN
jgi:hypothetical protein